MIGDADILTESLGKGGDITLGGAAVIALDDSDVTLVTLWRDRKAGKGAILA